MKLKSLFLCLAFLFSSAIFVPSQAQKHYSHSKSSGRAKTVHVKGYTKKNGTHVNSYRRSAPHRK